MQQPYPPQPYPQQPYPQQPYPQAQAVAPPAQYEFTAEENATIGVTAVRARGWGLISLFLGVGQLALSQLDSARVSTLTTATHVVGGSVSIVVGAVFIGVATSLRSVVSSRGNDVALMMQALRKLSTAFTIQIVVACVVFMAASVAHTILFM